MMLNKLKKVEKIIKSNKYLKLLLIQLTIIIVLVFIFVFVKSSLINLIPSCYWQENYGFNCPSCGSTRCIINLVNGNLKLAFFYNPFFLHILI